MKKFRLWYPAEKRMVYKGMLTFDMSDGSWLWEGRHGSFHSHFGELMEWVGFFDKKQKEIFEEDILQCGTARCVVRLIDGVFTFANRTNNWLDEWNWADDASRFEVIGNMYENPEKLTENKQSKITIVKSPLIRKIKEKNQRKKLKISIKKRTKQC